MAEEGKTQIADTVRNLEQEIARLERRRADQAPVLSQLQKDMAETERRLESARNRLKYLKPENLKVSDHCIMRYAQRHYGVPIEKIEAEIRAKVGSVATMGNADFEGFVIRNNVVVTYKAPQEEYPQ